MKNTLIITEYQNHFLTENRKDPITGDSFSIGDEIVFCAGCKSAFLKESWEYMKERHCNQNLTLSLFPSSSPLNLEKVVDKFAPSADIGSRFLAFFFDGLISVALTAIISFTANLFYPLPPFWSYTIFFIFMMFRDVTFGRASIGKRLLGLEFYKTARLNHRILLIRVGFRNAVYWLPNIALVYFTFTLGMLLLGILLFFIGFLYNLIYFLYLITDKNPISDEILNIRLMESDKCTKWIPIK
ncbi:hypothetical protein [Bernardetia sp.]|uniref:hypothetical protein n=1 Tax=Bernardetia sp. TaxID=1937974 RepID=UPI0025C25431|nr:hypothetical protein [Bernardetia sp.]